MLSFIYLAVFYFSLLTSLYFFLFSLAYLFFSTTGYIGAFSVDVQPQLPGQFQDDSHGAVVFMKETFASRRSSFWCHLNFSEAFTSDIFCERNRFFYYLCSQIQLYQIWRRSQESSTYKLFNTSNISRGFYYCLYAQYFNICRFNCIFQFSL